MHERLEAHFENRVYYFYLESQSDDEIFIRMYKTPYLFIKHNKTWINATSNKMAMADGLIEAVVKAISEAS
ncbi:hypothetical protein [Pararcticibacter amylolyticus]|uniref:Uncharacterized protein n=1 Tax=Pararcticibacter amylolyticus TaxID=2173175 RepID=A0A2U2PAR3_9SPHI|nr:hypothetical protein [Pararcticibacter amylolyticus]PWG78384.1 hypothetical protein DDR33_22750 [Pararcticibacter amylolyticus]